MRSQDMAHDSIRTEQTQLLGLLQERLDEAERAGEAALKLEPHEVEQLCSQAGIEDDAADVFRTLVRSNLVRVRGRWRDGRSAVRAPVYIGDLTERGTRVLAASSAHRSEGQVERL